MKICSPQLGLSPESNSGGEVHDREIINSLCQKGVKVFILLPRNRPYTQHKNLYVTHTSVRPIVPPHAYNLFVLPYLIKAYQQHKFDLLRVHNPYFVGPAAVIFKKIFPKMPLVATYHHLEKGINRLIDKAVVEKFDHIITVSQSTKKEIVSHLNYPKNKITVAYNGVDSRFQPGPKPKALIKKYGLENKTVLLFLGGLKSRKNPLFLLEIMRYLDQPNLCLVFAGAGPLLRRLKQKTEKLGLSPRVRFAGFVSESEKVSYYRLADVVLLPSLKEGFGMTIAEAGACAVPAIGSNNSSIKEIILAGKTGYLANTNDINDWTRKLVQLIKSQFQLKKMGRAAQKHVRQQCSWERSIQIHLKIYYQLINSY
jgi:glycosyltransferase involved in cell wall biosynthesis